MSDDTLTHKQRALAELELRRRETIKKLGPVYDWYGKPCMCSEYNPETKTCKKHPRALDHQRPPVGEWLAWLLMAGRSAGKLLSVETPIATPTGWSTMGELRVGDEVFDEQGKPCKVTSISPFEVPEVAYELEFSDGSTIEACSDHQWVTWTHADRKAYLRSQYEDSSDFPEDWVKWRSKQVLGNGMRVSRDKIERMASLIASGMSERAASTTVGVCRTAYAKHRNAGGYRAGEAKVRKNSKGPTVKVTQDIVDTQFTGKRQDNNHSIPCTRPLQLPEIELPVKPWTLGYYVANGSKRDHDVTAGSWNGEFDDKHVESCLAKDGYRFESCERNVAAGQTRIRIYGISDLLTSLGARDFHIDRRYLRASVQQRLELLRGLCDGDGYFDPGRLTVEFCTKHEHLAEFVKELVCTLGDKPVLSVGRATLNGKDYGPKYRVTWSPSLLNPFSLPRKARVFKDLTERTLEIRQRMIVGIRRIQPKLMRCISVDSPNRMYLAGKAMIPTHNTRSAAEWIRYQVESHAARGEQIRIALVNETVSEVRRVQIEGASGLLAVSPPWFTPVYIPSKAEVVWPNGSVAYIYSGEQPDQLRGPQHHFAWCDELCLTPDTVITCVNSDKPISQVIPGDMVLTRAGYRPVVAAWKTTDSAVVYRLIADDGSSIVGTAGHPVWVEGEGWVPLANVKPGSTLKSLTSCREGSVGPRSVSVERLPERSPVYNIEVEGEHEYFANGILTHNCKWSKAQAAVWDNLLLGMRLGVNPQIVVSTTPQPTPTLRAIIADKFTVMSRASTYANRHNLPEKFFESVVSKYEGTRIGRQELHAEVLLQNQNALWNQEQLDALRVRAVPYGVDIKKVVVGVDPAGKIGDMAKFVHGMPTEAGKGDEAGIVVAGLGTDGHGYILGDHSTSGSPDAWGRAVAEAYGRHQANSVVWESNHGGDMVRDVLLAVNPNIVQKRVHASRSKYVRAEPIGALAEQGKIHIVGELPKLESEMCDFEPGGPSPNRMDAMVFALTDLMIQPDEEKVELEFRRTSFKGLF